MKPDLLVSIDGPTASGKTTLGTALARHFGTAFLDTGLTFRAIAYALVHHDLSPHDRWRPLIDHRPLVYGGGDCPGPPDLLHEEAVRYKGEDIGDEVWSFDVDNKVDLVASNSLWRAEILRYHTEVIAEYPRIVVAGRDVATTLAKNATLHVALTASFAVRRERRRAQHRENRSRSVVVGSTSPLDVATLKAIHKLPNSVVLDTTYLPRYAVFASIKRKLEETVHGNWKH